MNSENRDRTKMQLLTAIIWATLLFIFVLGAKSEVAVGQDAPSRNQTLTLATAVDLALKQNLDIQIANIETARKQQERVIVRSALLPQAGFDADDAVTQCNTRQSSVSSLRSFLTTSARFRLSTSGQRSRLRSSI
jgi:outer membrane protein TolC